MKKKYLFVLSGYFALFGAVAAAQVVLNPVPAKIIGQQQQPVTVQELLSPISAARNLVEGREFYSPRGLAVDTSQSPPALFVADTRNNRVLGWKDATSFSNGAKADTVIGQKDLTATNSQGPLSNYNSGLSSPTSVAVDRSGNLFVLDTGNNRILRFPKPFDTAPEDRVADLVIGQADLKGYRPNRDLQAPTDSTIFTAQVSGSNIQILLASIAFDPEGNLWVTDAGNNRALRYNASDISGAAGSSIAANLVLGQAEFTTRIAAAGNERLSKTKIVQPAVIAFDQAGHLFLGDDLGRILAYTGPFASGQSASRILGVVIPTQAAPQPPVVSATSFGLVVTAANQLVYSQPGGLFTVENDLFVVDTGNHRILRFGPFSSWADETATEPSPAAAAVYGQPDFSSNQINSGVTLEPSASTFASPGAAAFANGELYLLDIGNNRALAMPYDAASKQLSPATRVLGQIDFAFNSPNLIVGREFSPGEIRLQLGNNQTAAITLGPAVAIDTTSNPPHLYIADTGNNRILGYNDARTVKFGEKDQADLVIGQVDFYRAIRNSPTNDPQSPTATGLGAPSSIAVDKQGNLWVADTFNGRVLRFPKPFENRDQPHTADLVIGQPDFTTKPTGEAARDRLATPSAIAFTPEGNLVVADLIQNRVLMFRQPATNGQPADLILGQQDATSTSFGNSEAQFSFPVSLAVDSFGRLYVADYGNVRVLVFDNLNQQLDGAPGVVLAVGQVNGVIPIHLALHPRTEELYVSDANSSGSFPRSRVVRYPQYDQLFATGLNPTLNLQEYFPRGVAFDANANIYVIDSASRLAMHYPSLGVVNGANGFARIAPAMIAQLTVPGLTLAENAATGTGPRLPVELADLEVLVDGVAAPLYRVGENTVRLIVPKGTRQTGSAEFLLRRPSTGEYVANARVAMSPYSPGVLYRNTNPGKSLDQARATNQDGSDNTTSKSVSVGQEITVYLTGHGAVDGLPDDGVAPGTEQPMSGETPKIYIQLNSTSAVECKDNVTSTLDPNEPGVWRVKCKIPTIPANGTFNFGIWVLYRSMASHLLTVGGTANLPTITVKQ